MLATLAVVFVVGFRVMTSGSRRAIRRLSERLGITPVPIESMIDQFGKSAGNEFIRYLERPDEAHLQNAAQVLLIWQVCIVDSSENNLLTCRKRGSSSCIDIPRWRCAYRAYKTRRPVQAKRRPAKSAKSCLNVK